MVQASQEDGQGRIKSDRLTGMTEACLVEIKTVDPEFRSDLRTNFNLKVARKDHDINGLPITREWKVRAVLDETLIYEDLYVSNYFKNNHAFLTVFDYYYSGKTACEAIDESVFSMAKALHHGGGQGVESLQRRCKIKWQIPWQQPRQ